ncbi:amidohydrolase family protein [Duganella sp. FT92W]|uniref:Amidohydrolase family protein n=1 Tax=Pseudoduganella rivuli TaxID=2666085 RepID=A0A7X2ITI9_9BURK|nr:amidohydrolase family protein [Pseudoduganella rivuli]MRV75733.1 amidohydrolase family protein [Pseudoduganella rivuli]
MKRITTVMALAIAAAFSAASSAPAYAVTTTTRYVIMSENGKQAGEQVVERSDDGQTSVRFIYKDNGRGPELTEKIRYAPDGTIASYAVKGNSTFGAVVDEQFDMTNGKAVWKSTTEKGEQPVNGPAMYVPLNSSFETASAAIAALAATPDNKLALLPSGTLTHRKLAETVVTRGTGEGKTAQTVQLLAQTGLGLSPQFFWATTGANGKPARLFAVVAPGAFVAVEEGWEGNGKTLAALQKDAEQKMLADLAATLQHPLNGLTVVKNARVFDSDKAVLGAPSDVYVLRGRITAVLPAGSPVRGAVNEIDAAGRVLLPGLFDMHGHVGRWEGGLNLAAGVTTVRDLGNDNAQLQLIMEETAAGKLLSPQVVPAGFLEGESPYSSNGGFVVKTLAEAKNAIDWYAQHGYPQLKIYNSFPKEILKETVAYAHLRGLRVSGHVPAGLRAFEALDAGYDEIQHINQVMLNFLATPQTETRTLERFILPADKTANLDFNSQRVKDFIARLAKQKTVVDPTLATFAFLKQKDGDINTPFAPIAGHMPPDVRRGFHVGTMKIADDATLKRYEKSYAKMVDFVGRLYKAGVPIVAGTDELAGFTLQAELELLVQAGLTPAQAIQVATRNGALYTRTAHERGSITPGKLADLVLVDGDPTNNIADIRKVAAVITRGYLVYPHEVDQALGVKPFVSAAPQVKALEPVSSNIAGSNDGVLQRVGLSARERD